MTKESRIEKIQAKFPGLHIEADGSTDLIAVRAAKDDIFPLCEFLMQTLSYNFLQFLTCIDRMDKLEIQYHIYSYEHKGKIIIKADIERTGAKAASVSGIWKTADWHERETYDFFGVIFEGHHNLKHILLEDDFAGHPLLKDFSAKNVVPLPKV